MSEPDNNEAVDRRVAELREEYIADEYARRGLKR